VDQNTFITIVVSVVTTFGASSGFWAYVMSRRSLKSATTKLLMGLAYDRITYMGMKFIEQKIIYKDEYEDFRRYLYEPYKELGGNGTADRIMAEIAKLPIHGHHTSDSNRIFLRREDKSNGTEWHG